MWSAVGVVFDCASKRSMTERMHGTDIDDKRRRGVDSEISGASIAHLEGAIFEVERAVTLEQEGSGRKQATVMVVMGRACGAHLSITPILNFPPR